MVKIISIVLLFSSFIFSASLVESFGQENNLVGGVSIAEDTIPPHPSAIFEVRSVSKGVILPQFELSELENDIISNPADGLLVYVIDTTQYGGIWYAQNGEWQQLKFRKAYYPMGSIIMYSSSIEGYFDSEGVGIHASTLGWHICNGNNGTPDLTDMFVVSYDAEIKEYSTYGCKNVNSNTYTLGVDSVPEHNHLIPKVTVSKNFSHTHELKTKNGTNNYFHSHQLDYLNQSGRPGYDYQRLIKSKKSKELPFFKSGFGLKTRANLSNTEGFIKLTFYDSGNSSPEAFDNRPAYYTLVYIMRTGPTSFPEFKNNLNPKTIAP